MKTYAVIGAGFSGTAFVVHMAMKAQRRISKEPIKIFLIDKVSFGQGIAYSTKNKAHILNIPISGMSLFPKEPEHFLKWFRKRNPLASGKEFVARNQFGKYLQYELDKAVKQKNKTLSIKKICDEVVSLRPEKNQYHIFLNSGMELLVDEVILAMGNYPPPHPLSLDSHLLKSSLYFSNPWAPLPPIPKKSKILIIGTGLSMIDKVLELNCLHHEGEIYAISRHGVIPIEITGDDCNNFNIKSTFIDIEKVSCNLLSLFNIIKQTIKKIKQEGGNFFCSFINHELFLTKCSSFISIYESRIKRHLLSYINILLHPVPKETNQVIQNLIKNNSLKIFAGKILKINKNFEKVSVEFLERSNQQIFSLNVDYVINCLGASKKIDKIDDFLIKNILDQALIRPNNEGMGIDISNRKQVINKSGQEMKGLYVLGFKVDSVFGSVSVVPALAKEVEELTDMLLPESSIFA